MHIDKGRLLFSLELKILYRGKKYVRLIQVIIFGLCILNDELKLRQLQGK